MLQLLQIRLLGEAEEGNEMCGSFWSVTSKTPTRVLW